MPNPGPAPNGQVNRAPGLSATWTDTNGVALTGPDGKPRAVEAAKVQFREAWCVGVTNLTLSGVQTIDGVVGVAGKTHVLAIGQATNSQNGPWIMQTAGWTRPPWYTTANLSGGVQYNTIAVIQGTTYAGSVWQLQSSDPIIVDTTGTTWGLLALAANSITLSNGQSALPSGGTTGQFPVKNSSNNGDVSWTGPVLAQTNSSTVVADTTTTPGLVYFYAIGLGSSTGAVLGALSDANGNVAFSHAIADQSYSLQTPSNAFSITIGNNISTLLLKPSAGLSTGTIVMPAAPVDGQIVRVASNQTVTTLTVNANSGQSISGAPSTITATSPFAMMYNLSNTLWFRID